MKKQPKDDEDLTVTEYLLYLRMLIEASEALGIALSSDARKQIEEIARTKNLSFHLEAEERAARAKLRRKERVSGGKGKKDAEKGEPS